MQFICIFLLILINGARAVFKPPENNPDFGRACGPGEQGAPKIQYYLDYERKELYPFFYLGCGGDNNYLYPNRIASPISYGKSPSTCSDIHFPGLPPPFCPDGYKCMKLMPSKCCSIDDENRFHKNYEAKCPPGSKGAQRDPAFEYQIPFFGRSCAHNFCQMGSTCIQGEFLAYCCLN